MQIIVQNKETFLLRVDPGEELTQEVEKFCAENKIHAAQVAAVGSTKELELAYFNVDTKEYETKKFNEFLEILNATGNIALKENKVFLHAHGLFGRNDMSTLGGHINRCVVSATAEVYIHTIEGEAHREFDEQTGLHLLS